MKKKIVKAVIWPVALYAAETWTLRKEEIRRLDAFEMWLWRKMEKISWTEKKTNDEVLQIVEESRQIVDTVMERKKKWIGHVLRGDGLMKEVIEGRMLGKRTRGRKRIGMLEELLQKEPYGAMKRRAEDRLKWKSWNPRTCQPAEH